MGGGLGREFLKSESAHALGSAPHPLPGALRALGVARLGLRGSGARARNGGARVRVSPLLGAHS